MPERNLKSLPKIRDSLTFIYVEHCMIEQDNLAIVKIDKDGRTPIPIAAFTVLMLGPGTSVTHAAIANIAACGCMAVWCGENDFNFYAYGKGETKSGRNLLQQVEVYSDPDLHLKCVRKMYMMRFPQMPSDNLTVAQLRGLEGSRVKTAYKNMASRTGITWTGREYKSADWDDSTPLNKALSMANAMLYAVCYSVIISLGYSPGIGFIHTGKAEAFVYDIADLYKVETTIPAAFEAVKAYTGEEDLQKCVRRRCRLYFHNSRLLKRIPEDIMSLLFFSADEDLDGTKELWDENGNSVTGGKNYSEDSKE